jgi:hypothetical protein
VIARVSDLLVFSSWVLCLRTNPGSYPHLVAHVRTVKTASGAVAVQVVWSSQRGSREIEHLGSAHDEVELEALKAAARQRVAAGQLEFDLGAGGQGPGRQQTITAADPLPDDLRQALDAINRIG